MSYEILLWVLFVILSTVLFYRRQDSTITTRSVKCHEFYTWRICGIPRGTTEHNLRQQIQTADISIPKDAHHTSAAQEQEVVKISLATYSSSHLCATVTARCRPNLPHYPIDDHFHGITPLYAPDDAQVDIVAVSGLGSHAVGSFKSRRGWQIWLRDFLPETVPAARILVYGYDTSLRNDRSKSSIGELAKSFLITLRTFRKQTNTARRPVIFIGHSLGGLLIKEAIALTYRDPDGTDSSDLYRSTSAFAFFGVPNLGIRYEVLREIVGGQPNKSLINTLVVDHDGEPSDYLAELTQKFVQTCRRQHPKFEMVSFYEKRESDTVQLNDDGHLQYAGPSRLLVTRDSAGRIGDEDNFFDHIPLDTDHSNLVKFVHSSDQNYTIVSQFLKDYADRAPETTRRRWSVVPSVGDEIDKHAQLILQSLAFPEMHYRRLNVEPRHRHTCEWILEINEFKQWVLGPQDLLWIKGKPGAGKSTVMAFLHGELKRIASKDLNESSEISLDFFFSARGVELQRTFYGMLRSLLHQLVMKEASTRRRVGAIFDEKAQSFGGSPKDWQWQISELRQLLAEEVVATGQRRPVTVFVDALDEAGKESARVMAEYFLQLNEQAAAAQSQVRICISCRHFPIVSSEKVSLEVVVEDHNIQDITAFIHDKICLDQVTSYDPSEFIAWQALTSELTRRAGGVFQWAYLVLPMVQEHIDKGKSPQEIRNKLQEIPAELRDVYIHIFEDVIDTEDHALSFRLFQWVCLAARPLTVTEMRFALVTEEHDLISTDDRMTLRVKSLSGALLEVVSSRYGAALHIQISHQSVNDFLLDGGLDLLASLGANRSPASVPSPSSLDNSNILLDCHARLYWTCLQYLSSSDVHTYQLKRNVHISRVSNQDLPFISYATINMFYHAERAGLRRDLILAGEVTLLQRLIPQWIKFYRALHRFGHDCPAEGTRLIHVASRANMTDMVENLIREKCYVETRDGAGQTALHHAVQKGHDSTTDFLLGINANIDAEDHDGKTPLVHAVGQGRMSLVTRLLEHGARPTSTTRGADGPLHVAACSGDTRLVKVLLDAGAKVGGQGGRYGNTLQAASVRGYEKVVQMLLDAGADVNAQGGLYDSALQAASSDGHDKVVQILLDAGADVNAQGGYHGNALQAASSDGHDKVVQMLLDTGADVNAQGGKYGNALIAASVRGYDKVVQILLDAGANVNAQGYHGNALQAASEGGHEKVVQMLLDVGADVNAPGGFYGNALQAASVWGREKVVQMLLNTGANVNTRGEHDDALQAASNGDYETVVQMLLDARAKIDA